MTESTIPVHVFESLRRLADNLWWCWDPDAPRMFEELAPAAWHECGHSPVALLDRVERGEVDAAPDPDRVAAIIRRFDAYMTAPTELRIESGASAPTISTRNPIVYFCAEYGLHESLPLYSGGLGVLAGDHLKAASDLGLPLIAIGLLYRRGYLTQRLAAGGEQVAEAPTIDPAQLPMAQVTDDTGKPVEVAIELPTGEVRLRAWRVEVGRITLYLLDANVPGNAPGDREITGRLYGGDGETRIRQELVLGFGGARLVRSLGLEPSVCHMNEGHAAFLGVERLQRMIVHEGMDLDAARARVRATTLFTTHTPVPAGHDRFDEALVRTFLSATADRLGLPWVDFMALGRPVAGSGAKADKDDDNEDTGDAQSDFNMTHLALQFSSFCNGVSELHGSASRRLLRTAWPELPEAEVPIATITNGIHLATWTAPSLGAALGARGRPVRGDDFDRADAVPPAELWQLKQHLKERLLTRVRAAIRAGATRRDDSEDLTKAVLAGLDGAPLLIGFARRFARYKRADLLMADPDRLAGLLGSGEQATRMLIAGKAHPRDEAGQQLLQRLFEASRREPLLGKIVVLEDYDMDLARHLVQGVDVWLNTPQRMMEASGTSGMKAAANGGLNLSIGDGWWPEAADGRNGWTIAPDRAEDDDPADAEALYRLLGEEVVPLFYQRDAHGLPTAWLDRVAHTLKTIPPRFDTQRMVEEYLDLAYRPLARAYFGAGP